MKRKRILMLISIAAMLLCVMTALTACSLFGKKETVVTPILTSVSLLKATPDYLKSNEYIYNKEQNNTDMAVAAGENFYISLNYTNEGNYAISYVTINNEKYMPSRFESMSTKTNTVIEIPTSQEDRNTELNIVIKNVFFTAGSETKRMKTGSDVQTQFTVKVSPTFQLQLDYQNADRRCTSNQPANAVSEPQSVIYGSTLDTVGLVDAKYNEPTGRPSKEGGWLFEGWYTQPNGQGIKVLSTDKYYFWSNVTLYAYFTRLFEYEIVELEEPIEYPYTGYTMEGSTRKEVSGVKEFTSAAIITKGNTRGYPNLRIDETIVDEKIVIDSATGKESVASVEYPVIRVARGAFLNVNSIITLYIGKFVEGIEYAAFQNCNAMESVTFHPECVLKYIGDFAFQDTKAMGKASAVTLPAAVEYLGNFAFRHSGWSATNNGSGPERIIHIRPTYKFIGVQCFMDTGFNGVVFDPGCYFESQIDLKESSDIEVAKGWRDVDLALNRIGSNLFAGCKNIESVAFLRDDGESNALNIVPDCAFDAGNYSVKQIKVDGLELNEGIEIIGKQAFNYQEQIGALNIPSSVKEIYSNAFYNCTGVQTLDFVKGSQLEILHSNCFGNLTGISSVEIISENFRKYGNGPFRGCTRLKSIEFSAIDKVENVPSGFSREDNSDEVLPGHKFADLMYGTFENGKKDDGTTYSIHTRVFCNKKVLETFKTNIKEGKGTYTFNSEGKVTATLSEPKYYENVVFVHDRNNIVTYRDNEGNVINKIAFQEVYDATVGAAAKKVKGYSIVFWSARNTEIVLPSTVPDLGNESVIELGMYALPTSVQTLYIPASIVRLEHDALNGCVNLDEVIFENIDTLQYVGNYAFFGTKIESFTGGEKLKVIGQNAFMRCKSLRWVDLGNTAITNPPTTTAQNPKLEILTQFKYEYELTDDNGKRNTDFIDTLYDGAFQGCINLSWVKLPQNLRQVSNALFTGCEKLRTVIIPSVKVSDKNSPTEKDNNTFYANATPAAIFDSYAAARMSVYVPGDEMETHEKIYPTPVGAERYFYLEEAPEHP